MRRTGCAFLNLSFSLYIYTHTHIHLCEGQLTYIPGEETEKMKMHIYTYIHLYIFWGNATNSRILVLENAYPYHTSHSPIHTRPSNPRIEARKETKHYKHLVLPMQIAQLKRDEARSFGSH